MATEIDYGTTPDLAEKRQRALNDMTDWFGKVETMPNLMREVAELPHTYEAAYAIRWQLGMFAGVQGYPVIALLAECWNMTDDEVVELFEANDPKDEE